MKPVLSLFLSLFLATPGSWAQGPVYPITASRITRGAGIPSASSCAVLNDVGKVYIRNNAGAPASSNYTCVNNGASTYAWELPNGSTSGSSTGLTSPSTLLPNWYANMAINQNQNSRTPVVVAYFGDSWVAASSLGNTLSDWMRAGLGDAGAGYSAFDTVDAVIQPGVTVSKTGTWTTCNKVSTCVGLNAYDLLSTDTGTPATATMIANATTFVVHYYQQLNGGTFSWSIDGGSGCGGTCSGTQATAGAATYSTLSLGGLTNASHTLLLTVTVAGSAGVRIMGADAQIAAPGVRLHNMGNTGAKSNTIPDMTAATWQAGLTALNPSLVIYTIGANDEGANVTPTALGTNIQTFITQVKAAVPSADIVLVPPTEINGTFTYNALQYNNQQQTTAASNSVAIVRSYELFGAYSSAVTRGLMITGDVHPTPAGVKAITGNIMQVLSLQREKVVSGDASLADTYYRYGILGNSRTWNDSTVGSELVTNGQFASGSSWSLGTGWTISGAALNASIATPTGASSNQTINLYPDHTYRLVYTISSYTSGSVVPIFTSTPGSVSFTTRSATGTYIEYMTIPRSFGLSTVALVNGTITFGQAGIVGWVGSISSVSVAEVQGGDVVANGSARARNLMALTACGGGDSALGNVGCLPRVVSVTVPLSDLLCAHANDSSVVWSNSATCNNTVTDAGAVTVYASSATLPAAMLTVGKLLRVTAQFQSWTTSTAPQVAVQLRLTNAAGTLLFNSGLNTVTVSKTGAPWSAQWLIAIQAASKVNVSALQLSMPGFTAANGVVNSVTGMPASVSTSVPWVLFPAVQTGLTGIASGTYTSGISATGTIGQTCALTAFNNSNSGGTATVALTGTNTIAGGTALVITNTGIASASGATSATAGNGTATCSGTATVATVLGGAQGNATQLLSLMVEALN